MYYVYVLRNEFSRRHYIGSTNNLHRRLEEHNRGHTRSTKSSGKWEIVYTEQFQDEIEARRRELKIKSYKGGNAFKKLFDKRD
jgi:putative endonuclease